MKVTIRNYRLPITTSFGTYWYMELSQVSQSLFLGTRKIKCDVSVNKERLLHDLAKTRRYMERYGRNYSLWSVSANSEIPNSVRSATTSFCDSLSRCFYSEGQSFLDNFMGENVSAINQAVKRLEPRLSALSDGNKLLSELENYLIQRNML